MGAALARVAVSVEGVVSALSAFVTFVTFVTLGMRLGLTKVICEAELGNRV